MKIDYNKICEALQKTLPGSPERLTAKEANKIRAVIEASFNAPNVRANYVKAAIQASQTGTGVSTNFDKITNDLVKVFNEGPIYDNLYELAFEEVQATEGTWTIASVTDGVTFEQVPEGHALKLRSMQSGLQTARTAKYGAAMGWTDEMIRHRELARMQSLQTRIVNRYWRHKADQHYGLLAAAAPVDNSNSNVTVYDTTAGNTQVARDIDTIDAASFALGNRNKEKDYDMNRALLYLPMSLKKRIGKAFNVSAGPPTLSSSQAAGSIRDEMAYDVQPLYTWNTNIPANTGIMVLPGNLIQRVDEVPPFFLNDTDILSLQYIIAMWTYYGAAIGDTGQVQRVLFA